MGMYDGFMQDFYERGKLSREESIRWRFHLKMKEIEDKAYREKERLYEKQRIERERNQVREMEKFLNSLK